MQETYNPQQLEPAVQSLWKQHDVYRMPEDSPKEKFYCLSMLPYPSGQLHVGHVRNYTIGDVVARFKRMEGFNVLHPMGWDAFGLPAENAAIANGVPPAQWTYQNIAQMRSQLDALGFSFDWSHEIATCDPSYYRWEQWLFLQMYKKGLVYKKKSTVNWDPVDNTVLANEQVIDGKGWRSGAAVEQREIEQWFFAITKYAPELLADLDNLPGWPDEVKLMQKNWIGKSEGTTFKLSIIDTPHTVELFTTRIDTLFGVSFIAVGATHPLITGLNNPELSQFIHTHCQSKVAEATLSTMAKKGMFTGLYARHPFTDAPIPVWVTNYVLAEYGTGALMGVPAHDVRDHEFATTYQLPILSVVQGPTEALPYTGEGVLQNSSEFSGLESTVARQKITQKLQQQGIGETTTHYRLRDWGVSRQRYWGAPIPMISCPTCKDVPVPEADLPVVLPQDVVFTGVHSPLPNMPEFYNCVCPQCHGPAKRQTDTFDTFVESSWYFLRYPCSDQNNAILDARAEKNLPIDLYVGGIEHAILHLLYARFFHKVIRDLGFVTSNEPVTNLLTQGMVLKDGAKMSKSKGNTVSPTELLESFGADSVRLFILFAAPPQQSLEWSDSGMEGAHRFLKRTWRLAANFKAAHPNVDYQAACPANTPMLKDLQRAVHSTLQKVQQDINRRAFNTAISALMTLVNTLHEVTVENAETAVHMQFALRSLALMLNPLVPHFAQGLWEGLGYTGFILEEPYPAIDLAALETDTLILAVQINGKRRAELNVAKGLDNKTLETMVLQDPNVVRHLGDKKVMKVIIVPNRLINIVVAE